MRLGFTTGKAHDLAGLCLPEEDSTTRLSVVGSSGLGKSGGYATRILNDIRNAHGQRCPGDRCPRPRGCHQDSWSVSTNEASSETPKASSKSEGRFLA